MSVKLSDVAKLFSGTAGQDIVKWIGKVEMVATLQKVEDLANFVPLFLDGDAYEIYSQLDEEAKKDYKEVKKALVSSFSLTPVQAFDAFKKRCLKQGEQPDAFLADLRRLISLVGTENDTMVACQFILGMPKDVAGQLTARKHGSLDPRALLECAKEILMNRVTEEEDFKSPIAAAGRSVRYGNQNQNPGAGGGRPWSNGAGRGGNGSFGPNMSTGAARPGAGSFGPKWFGCGRNGHAQATCPVVCFKCKQKGHIRRNCSMPDGGNMANPAVGDTVPASGNADGEASFAHLDASPYPMGYQ